MLGRVVVAEDVTEDGAAAGAGACEEGPVGSGGALWDLVSSSLLLAIPFFFVGVSEALLDVPVFDCPSCFARSDNKSRFSRWQMRTIATSNNVRVCRLVCIWTTVLSRI